MKRHWLIAAACTIVVGNACAEDLVNVYDKSLAADPTMQQAEATHLATRETKTQALLNMLPVNGSASKSWSGVQGGATTTQPAVATLGLTVNLFSWNSWINLKQANATVAQGEADYQVAQQDLISRVAQRYFAVLSAEDQLAAQESALRSAARQLEQAERRFEVGLIAVTDVQIARAARDSSSADVIAARRTLSSAHEQLRTVTGEKYERLAAPRSDMPLLTPEPASEDAWVATALDQNASLISSRMASEISHDRYLTAVGGHLPNITLGASRNWALQDNNTANQVGGINTDDITWTASVSVPLFSAGATQSRVRAAKYSWNAAKAGFERTLRQTEQQARDAYQGVISQIAQVQALRQAVESNQVSLQATEAGYDVGTKTALDVLTARQQLVQAQTRYTQAKYSYLNNIVSLRLAAGNLDRATITQINGWLAENTTDSTAPAAAPAATPAPAAVPAT
jgi:outer membrane protein